MARWIGVIIAIGVGVGVSLALVFDAATKKHRA